MFTANALFYVLSTLLVISSFTVIIAQHPVFSLLSLVISFIISSFLLFLVECEFLALIFLTIYVGAIAILFLFSIMLLESKLLNLHKSNLKYIPVGFIFVLFLLIPLFTEISINFEKSYNHFYLNIYQNWYDLIDSTFDLNIYNQILYSYFIFHFLLSGLILLLVLIAVIFLTNNFVIQSLTDQFIFKQLSRNFKPFFKDKK